MNRYAFTLTMAKLFPPENSEYAINEIEKFSLLVEQRKKSIDLRKVPYWVREFFHKETLREIIAWVKVLEDNHSYFLISCLLGILHHQRPGFLSFPSSHTVPYLRIKKFPKKKFPELYEYRDVKSRLIKKTIRAFKRVPLLPEDIFRLCFNEDATNLVIDQKIDAVISSPPYMRQLDYARA